MLSRVLSHIGQLSALLPAYCGNLSPALGSSLPLPSDSSSLIVRCAFWPVSLAILPPNILPDTVDFTVTG